MVADLSWGELPLRRKSLLPGEGFFVPAGRERRVAPGALAEAEIVVLADADADGLTAAALLRTVHPDALVVPTEPQDLAETLERVAGEAEEVSTAYVLDLSPDRFEPIGPALRAIVERADRVVWLDHHEWDPGVEEAVVAAGVDLVVGASDEVATADVALEYLDRDLDDRWADLVAVVRDHDLWLREDPRSDDIADFAHWSSPEEFIETVADHGADLPPDVEDMLAERRTEKRALVDAAVDRAEYRDVGDVTVGITYGRCSQNEVAEAMREAGADVAVVIKPSGGISLRGTAGFQRCHEVARRVGGGGHPEAAGCKPEIYDDLLDYAHHWTTQGATARHVMLAAFREVIEGAD